MPTKAVCFHHKSTLMVPEPNTDFDDMAIILMISLVNITLILMSGVVSGQLHLFILKKQVSLGFTCDALILQFTKQMWMNMLVNDISDIEILFRISYMTFLVNLKGFYQMLLLYCSSSLCH